MTNILDFFKQKSKSSELRTYERAKDMCERMELEVIKAIVKNYLPGTVFTLKVLDNSEELVDLCMKMGRFCADHVPDSVMQSLVLPKPVYIDKLDKHFDTDTNPDLKVYTLVAVPMFKAACNMVYGEYLRIIDDRSSEQVQERYNVYVSQAVDLCNVQKSEYHYKSYAAIIAVRKACIKLNTFVKSLDKDKRCGLSEMSYDATTMSRQESEMVKAIEMSV